MKFKHSQVIRFKKVKQLTGITDYDVNCEAANYVDLFVKQRKKLLRQKLMLVKWMLMNIIDYIINFYINLIFL